MTLGELLYSVTEVRDANKDGEVWIQCPFCGDEKFRMGINIDEGLAHCFRGSCEWKTRDKTYLFTALAKHFKVDATIDYLEHKKIKIQNHPKERKTPLKINLPGEYEALWTGINEEIGEKALDYVLKRGITDRQIEHHKLGFCAHGEYAYRIIFPVVFHGKVVGYTGRDFTDKSKTKYLNSKGIKTLYNIPRFKKKRCVLSEGPIDALAIERAVNGDNVTGSMYDSVGRLGTGFSGFQMKIIRNWDELIIWPDPDKAGVDLAVKTATVMLRRIKVSVVMIQHDDEDPGKLGETKEGLDEIKRRIEKRIQWDDNIRVQLYSKL